MDSKKKKKVAIISIIVAVILIAILITGIVLGVKKHDDDLRKQELASQMSTITQTNTYNEAIAKKEISQNYNGVYTFKSVKQLEFAKELTKKDIESICINKTSKPYVNDLLNYLQNEREKLRDNQDEKLVFFNGQYNKNINDNPFDKDSDRGLYVGNDDLSMVTAQKSTFFISLNYADINNNIPVSDKQNIDKTKIYLMEKVYSKENPNRLLFTITYVYEIVDEEIKQIPDNELNFDI